MKAIVIAGPVGAGKSTVAEIVAKDLGIKFVDGGDALRELGVAKGYNLQGKNWKETPAGLEFINRRRTNPDFDRELDAFMIKKAEEGDVVMTSRTMPWLAKGTINVWLKASMQKRVERLSMRDKISKEESEAAMRRRDEMEFEIYKKMYGFEYGKDMKPFQIIVDTDKLTKQQAADEVLVEIRKILR